MAVSKQKRRAVLTLFLAALALFFTLFVFAPMEQYVLNQSEMWFDLIDIVPLSLACFALLTALLTLAGFFLKAKARRVLTAVLIALAVCFYLQGNVLNPDYGELDGRAVDWGQYTLYAVWSGALWLSLIAASVILSIKKRKLFVSVSRAISGVLVLVQAVTLVTVLLTHPIESKRTDWIVSDKDQFMLGDEGNTVMFVIDACDNTYIPRIMDEDPDALSALDGFTWLSDYAGSYSKTKMGFPYLLTGEWYENDETVDDYIARCYTATPLYTDLKAAGWNVRLYTAETYMSRDMVGVADNVIASQLTVGSYPKLFAKMMEFVGFRYAPHVFKPAFVFYSGEFGFYKAAAGAEQPYFKDNFLYRNKLEADGLSVGAGKQFIVYHINGSHLPCNMDEHGANVGSWNTVELEQTKGVFRTIIAPYLNEMKALGLYDGANIIITADHGRFDEGPSSPVMLIKPAGASGALAESTAMGSVSDMPATLRVLCGLAAEGDDLLSLDPLLDRPRRYLYYPTTRQNGGTLPLLTEYNVGRGQVFTETGVVLPGGAENITRE